MGLGLNGGGLGAARFLHARGARVTVTDLKTAGELRPAVDALPAGVGLSLGSHRMGDFTACDLVVKNPGVPPDSPFLAAARDAGADVETEQSLFLARCPAPVLAVTGSKGKSTTTAALAAILREKEPATRLSGNIGGSPLDFLDELTADTPVVLELSSWQLGDLRGRGLLAPPVAVVTNLLRDHQNRYGSMEEYLQDKRVIAEAQPPDAALVLNADDPWHRRFADGAAARIVLWLRPAASGGRRRMAPRTAWAASRWKAARGVAFDTAWLPAAGRVIGSNLVAAAAAAASFGIEPATIRRASPPIPRAAAPPGARRRSGGRPFRERLGSHHSRGDDGGPGRRDGSGRAAGRRSGQGARLHRTGRLGRIRAPLRAARRQRHGEARLGVAPRRSGLRRPVRLTWRRRSARRLRQPRAERRCCSPLPARRSGCSATNSTAATASGRWCGSTPSTR